MDLRSTLRDELRLRAKLMEVLPPMEAGAQTLLFVLALARIEGRRVGICEAYREGGLSSTSGLRHIGRLLDVRLIRRESDPNDGRRGWLFITDDGFARIEAVFAPASLRAVA